MYNLTEPAPHVDTSPSDNTVEYSKPRTESVPDGYVHNDIDYVTGDPKRLANDHSPSPAVIQGRPRPVPAKKNTGSGVVKM